jgi:hypothetical protein
MTSCLLSLNSSSSKINFRQTKNAWSFWPAKNGKMDTHAESAATPIFAMEKPHFPDDAPDVSMMNQLLLTPYFTVAKSIFRRLSKLPTSFAKVLKYHRGICRANWKSAR